MPVLYEKRNHVGWLTLSRPEARNCWGEDFNEEIIRLCDEMATDPEVRGAVLTGNEAGGAFSAGANLKDPKTHSQASMAEFIEALPKRHRSAGQVLSEFPKPLIAWRARRGPKIRGRDPVGLHISSGLDLRAVLSKKGETYDHLHL